MTEIVRNNLAGMAILPVLAIVMAMYVTASLVWGDRGVMAYMDLQRTHLNMVQSLQSLSQQRVHLEGEIRFLRDNNLKTDRLEEEARQNLKVVADDEVVIMRD